MPRYRVTLRRTTVEIVEATIPMSGNRRAGSRRRRSRDRGRRSGRRSSVDIEHPAPSEEGSEEAAAHVAANPAKLAQNLIKARAARAGTRKTSGQRSPSRRARSVQPRRNADRARTRRCRAAHSAERVDAYADADTSRGSSTFA